MSEANIQVAVPLAQVEFLPALELIDAAIAMAEIEPSIERAQIDSAIPVADIGIAQAQSQADGPFLILHEKAQREVYFDEEPAITWPAISFVAVPGGAGLMQVKVNVP